MGFCPFNLLVIWYFFYQRCGAILIVVFFDLSYLDAKKYENKEIRIHYDDDELHPRPLYNGYTITMFWNILKFSLTHSSGMVLIHENVIYICPL